MQEKRETFRAVEHLMANHHGLEIDAEAAEDSRRRAREETSVLPIATNPASRFATEASGDSETPDDYFLDSEFVAVYW